jgi:hypothetical protein
MIKIAAAVFTLCCLPCMEAQAAGVLPTQHFVVIGIDGLSVDGVRNAKAAYLRGLMERGAWTLEARGVMPTLSSPNWESMITGSAPEQHGVTSNGILRKMIEFQPVCLDAEGKFPTIFEILRAQRPESRIAVFHDWEGFADLLEKNVPDVLQHERGPEKTIDAAVKYWTENRPNLMFVHLDNVDHAGHDAGWSSPEYYRAVEEADACVNRLASVALASDDTYVLVTSDHGGKGRNHGKNSLEEIQIPWILAGPDVAVGKIAGPVNTFDTAATIAWLFGLTTPECWIGRPVTAAFRNEAVAARIPAHKTAASVCAPETVQNVAGSGAPGGGPDSKDHR